MTSLGSNQEGSLSNIEEKEVYNFNGIKFDPHPVYLALDRISELLQDPEFRLRFGVYLLKWAYKNSGDMGLVHSLATIVFSNMLAFLEDKKIEDLLKDPNYNDTSLFDLLEGKLTANAIRYINLLLQNALGVSPFRDCIFSLLNAEKGLYAIVDYYNGYMARVRVDSRNEEVKLGDIVSYALPLKWIVIYDPLGSPRRYRVDFLIGKRVRSIEGELPIIADRLEMEGVVVSKRLNQDVLSAILNLNDPNRKEEVENTFATGVYIIQGKVKLLNKEWSKDFDLEDLKRGLRLLEKIANYYDRGKFSLIIKWGLWSPFSYVFKDLGLWGKWLYLYGRARAGKSTLGEIVLSLYGEDTFLEKTGVSIDTEYRLGEVLRLQTFPIVINEAEGFFGKRRSDLIDMINNAVQKKISRGKYYKGSYTEYPALAPLLMTSNYYLPSNPALRRRFIKIGFTQKDAVDPMKEAEFNALIRPEFKDLEAIGYFAIREGIKHLNDNLHVFREFAISPLEFGHWLLAKLYSLIGEEMPDIFEKEALEEGEEEEDLEEMIRSFFLDSINEAYAKYIGRIRTDSTEWEGEKEIMVFQDIEERVKAVLEAKVISGLFLKDNQVIITKVFISKLEDQIVGLGGLRGLADLLGWGYKKFSYREENKVKSNQAVLVSLEDFIRFLQGE